MQKKTGVLYVVATPIGNLQDITLRAIEILKTVDLIAAEDTRHSAGLLKHFSIQKPTISMHEFNERKRVKVILDHLQAGKSIALISDAGTPLISDPGYHLVAEAKAQGVAVVPIPGPCAAIAALSVAGFATDRFVFEGFLPAKKQARTQQLNLLVNDTRTLIFYEAPHRLLSTLKDMAEVFGGERKAVIAKELTKLYESFWIDHLQKLIEQVEANSDMERGEIVILVEGSETPVDQQNIDSDKVLAILLEALPLKQATTLASKITGERKNTLYKLALNKKHPT